MLKELLTKKKLLFNHETPEDFVRSLWQKETRVSLIWVCYRIFLLTYLIGGIIMVCARPSPGYVCRKNMIYFINWTYLGLILAFIFSCAACVQRYMQEKKNPELPPMEKMSDLYKVFWCFYITCLPCALGLTVMFWVFVYDPDHYETLFYTILNHVANPLVMIMDFFIAATPFRFLHIYCPLLLAIIYMCFTIIYQMSGGTGNKGQIPIYPIMDWRDPKIATSTCAVSVGCVVIVHGILGVFNMVKQFLKNLRERGIERDSTLEDET